MNRVVKELLKKRGYTDSSDIEEFLSRSPKLTYDPFMMKGMCELVERVHTALLKKEKICIYGDYDTDGVTATCILKTALLTVSEQVTHYIPSRFEEGYGLNKEAIEHLYCKGIDLIITVDCGIVSYDEVERAKSLGMDIIITDHHALGEKLPKCIIVNTNQSDCTYPFKPLAGCGVAFKVVQALKDKGIIPKSVISEVLDLVSIGTVGDLMPLIGENRTLVKHSLRMISRGHRIGLAILLEKLNISRDSLTSTDIGFKISPHINAAGRMNHANLGVDLLMSSNKNEAEEYADLLIGVNKERKEIQNETLKICCKLIDEQCKDDLFPIVHCEDGHEGILGIVASSLVNRVKKPVLLLTGKEDYLKGSCRTFGKIDIYKILSKHRDFYVNFGGHKEACGLTIKKDELDSFRLAISQTMCSMKDIDIIDNITADVETDNDEINMSLAKELMLLEPYGKLNENPVFKLDSCQVTQVISLGPNKEHRKFFVQKSRNEKLQCIFFSMTEEDKKLIDSNPLISIWGNLSINYFNGNSSLQFQVKEIINEE